jgi:hypothetical protein
MKKINTFSVFNIKILISSYLNGNLYNYNPKIIYKTAKYLEKYAS